MHRPVGASAAMGKRRGGEDVRWGFVPRFWEGTPLGRAMRSGAAAVSDEGAQAADALRRAFDEGTPGNSVEETAVNAEEETSVEACIDAK